MVLILFIIMEISRSIIPNICKIHLATLKSCDSTVKEEQIIEPLTAQTWSQSALVLTPPSPDTMLGPDTTFGRLCDNLWLLQLHLQ